MEALHPISTHLPIALALVIPVIMFLVLFFNMRGTWALSTWFIPVLLAALAFGGAYYARDMGGHDAGCVIDAFGKEAVGEAIHEHAEWSGYFYWTYAGVFIIAFLGLILPRYKSLRLIAFFASLGALIPMYYTGKLGGELVYEKGVAAAFVQKPLTKNVGGLDTSEADDD